MAKSELFSNKLFKNKNRFSLNLDRDVESALDREVNNNKEIQNPFIGSSGLKKTKTISQSEPKLDMKSNTKSAKSSKKSVSPSPVGNKSKSVFPWHSKSPTPEKLPVPKNLHSPEKSPENFFSCEDLTDISDDVSVSCEFTLNIGENNNEADKTVVLGSESEDINMPGEESQKELAYFEKGGVKGIMKQFGAKQNCAPPEIGKSFAFKNGNSGGSGFKGSNSNISKDINQEKTDLHTTKTGFRRSVSNIAQSSDQEKTDNSNNIPAFKRSTSNIPLNSNKDKESNINDKVKSDKISASPKKGPKEIKAKSKSPEKLASKIRKSKSPEKMPSGNRVPSKTETVNNNNVNVPSSKISHTVPSPDNTKDTSENKTSHKDQNENADKNNSSNGVSKPKTGRRNSIVEFMGQKFEQKSNNAPTHPALKIKYEHKPGKLGAVFGQKPKTRASSVEVESSYKYGKEGLLTSSAAEIENSQKLIKSTDNLISGGDKQEFSNNMVGQRNGDSKSTSNIADYSSKRDIQSTCNRCTNSGSKDLLNAGCVGIEQAKRSGNIAQKDTISVTGNTNISDNYTVSKDSDAKSQKARADSNKTNINSRKLGKGVSTEDISNVNGNAPKITQQDTKNVTRITQQDSKNTKQSRKSLSPDKSSTRTSGGKNGNQTLTLSQKHSAEDKMIGKTTVEKAPSSGGKQNKFKLSLEADIVAPALVKDYTKSTPPGSVLCSNKQGELVLRDSGDPCHSHGNGVHRKGVNGERVTPMTNFNDSGVSFRNESFVSEKEQSVKSEPRVPQKEKSNTDQGVICPKDVKNLQSKQVLPNGTVSKDIQNLDPKSTLQNGAIPKTKQKSTNHKSSSKISPTYVGVDGSQVAECVQNQQNVGHVAQNTDVNKQHNGVQGLQNVCDRQFNSGVNTDIVQSKVSRDTSDTGKAIDQVFFRTGALSQLEDLRDEKITGQVVSLQARCRGYIGRQKLKKLKLQHLAVSCIQRNVRKYMAIQHWSWWRLYTKVQPLLNVHKTEEELRDREIELEQMKLKIDKLEKERTDYKNASDRLETKLNEITADLAEEHTTSNQATEVLESEQAERIRLERELKDITSKFSTLQRKHEQTELDLYDARMLAASLDEELEAEDDESGGIYRERYERCRRELEFTKKKLQQRNDEDMEQHSVIKKQQDRKYHEALEEVDDQKRQVSNLKKKIQRVNQEHSDTRRHLEEQVSRNTDLEKKQRKFDSELNKVTESMRHEKLQREKLQRERDELAGDKYTIEQELKSLQVDMELQTEKVARLDRELQDMSDVSRDDKEVMHMKRMKNELERKVLDQEEELDEQAGTIQQLEQAKLRLEMAQENSRQQHMKELEEKENELEDLRASSHKKLKSMEAQMEEEYENNKNIAKEKRELERKMKELSEMTPSRDRDVEKRLRRDLKRTKALLQDAHVMIDKQKENAGGRGVVKQLRNQLEDAEYAASAAMKARKGVEMEVQELQAQLDSVAKSKQDADERCTLLAREKNDLMSRIEDNEEDVAEIMKKYNAAVKQQSADIIIIQDQSRQIEELHKENQSLKEQISSLESRIEYYDTSTVDKEALRRLELKIRELDSKVEFEKTAKLRAESIVSRLKEQVESLTAEKEHACAEELRHKESSKRHERQLRDLQELHGELERKEAETSQHKENMERKISSMENDYEQCQSDLRLAFKRISDLQGVIEDEMDSADDSELGSDELDMLDSESDSDDDLSLVSGDMPTSRSIRLSSIDGSVSGYSAMPSADMHYEPIAINESES